MSRPLGILSYAGRDPAAPRGVLVTCWRAIVWMMTAAIYLVIVTLRGALLLAGFACLFAGLILLTLGGKVSAGRKLIKWRERFIDLSRLWLNDITRPLRRGHRTADPLPVVTVTPQ